MFVLDLSCKDGKKIPKWKQRSKQGKFLGFSKSQYSTVGLIINLQTGYVSPKFNVVNDDWFYKINKFHEKISNK